MCLLTGVLALETVTGTSRPGVVDEDVSISLLSEFSSSLLVTAIGKEEAEKQKRMA